MAVCEMKKTLKNSFIRTVGFPGIWYDAVAGGEKQAAAYSVRRCVAGHICTAYLAAQQQIQKGYAGRREKNGCYGLGEYTPKQNRDVYPHSGGCGIYSRACALVQQGAGRKQRQLPKGAGVSEKLP